MILEDYEALKCRYPSKKCWNQRAVKRNGERHNLCEMHRQKANNNQRRLDKKRKAGHQLKSGGAPVGPVGVPGAPARLELRGGSEPETAEYDYRLNHHLQQQNQHQVQLQIQQQQQYLYHQQQQHALHHQQQQEKRLRVSLSHMYAAAQSLSPHSPPRHAHAHHHPYRRQAPGPMTIKHEHEHEHELAPLRPSAALPRPQPAPPSASRPGMLQLPPLTTHIPSMRSSPLRLPTPAGSTSSSASSSASPSSSPASSLPLANDVKPTILLPPITSVPRCLPSSGGAFPLPRGGGVAPSAPLPSWSSFRSEEKINSA